MRNGLSALFKNPLKKGKHTMKLNPIGSNQTEIEYGDGVTVFYSYKTPVAAFVPGKGALCTSTKYSQTTSKHITRAVQRWDATRTNVDQGVIDQYAERSNLAGV
jgi:hypothetical protein